MTISMKRSGRRTKDLRDNVDKYAALGITEYFVFDRRKLGILPQGGRYLS